MEVKSVSDMAKLLSNLMDGIDDDDLWNYSENLEIVPPVVNTITIKDKHTGKLYLVNVKEVK